MNIKPSQAPVQSLNSAVADTDLLMKKLVAGKRVQQAADDAAGLQIINRLTLETNSASQGIRNIYDGISLANVAEQTLSGVSDGLAELNQLTIQAGNGMLSDVDRQALQEQALQLTQGIAEQLKQSNFAGKPLFDGQQNFSFSVPGSQSSTTLSVDTQDLSAEFTNSGVLSIDLTDKSALTTQQEQLKSFAAMVEQGRSMFGATVNRFDSAARSLLNNNENMAAAKSRIADLDYANAVSTQVASQIKEQAATAMQGQARISSQQAMQLLL